MTRPSSQTSLLVLGSALLYSASFPPLALIPLAWVALVPLFVAVGWDAREARGALGLGALWGGVVCVATGWPFASMLSSNLGLPPFFGWLAFVVGSVVLFVAPTAALTAWLSWVIRRRGTIGPLIVAAAWGTYELLREFVSFDIPWSSAATSQAPLAVVRQLADIGGASLIGMLVAAVNATLAGLAVPELRGTRPGVGRLAVVVSVAIALAYGEWRLQEDVDESRPVAIAVVQGGASPVTPTSTFSTELLEHYLELTGRAPGAELVFWPEFAIDFLPVRFTKAQKRLVEGVREADVDLVFGGPYEQIELEGIRHFNAAYSIHQGRVRDWYEKERPLWFSERDLFGIRAWLGMRSYEPGTRSHPLEVDAGTVGVVLCSEVMNPRLVRQRVADGAAILANPSNDAWLAADGAMRQQLAIAQLRAVENRRYLVRATTTGYSAVIDPRGEIVRQSSRDEPAVLEAEIFSRTERTPYQRFGEIPLWLGVLTTLAVSAVSLRGTARRPGT